LVFIFSKWGISLAFIKAFIRLLDEVNLTDAPVVLHLIVLVFHAAHSPCL